MDLIKSLTEAMEAIVRAGERARAAQMLDSTSVENLAVAHSLIDRVLVRLRFEGS